MATNLKNESLYSLQMYVQFIETLSNEMIQFFEEGVKKQKEAGNVSQSYYEEIEENIKGRILTNNEILDKIEKEIQSRIKKKFPSIISFRQLSLMGKALDTEIANQKAMFPVSEKDADKKIIDFKASREKRHVKK